MEQRCFERMGSDRDVLIEDFGDAVHFTALSADGRLWLEEEVGGRKSVLKTTDRTVAVVLTRRLFKSGLKFRISVDAEALDKVELLKAAFYGPDSVRVQ